MFFGFDFKVFLPGLILLIAIIDDLRSRKIHNKLILFLLPFVLLAVFLLNGFDGLRTGGFSVFLLNGFNGLKAGGFSALLALLIGVPLALGKVIGGGDLKLLVLFALTVKWPALLEIVIYSFPWALLLGIFKIALDKKIKDFFFNLIFLFRYKKVQDLKLHSIPFSLALFVAWLSFLTLKGLAVH